MVGVHCANEKKGLTPLFFGLAVRLIRLFGLWNNLCRTMPRRIQAHSELTGVESIADGQNQQGGKGDSYSQRVPKPATVRFACIFE